MNSGALSKAETLLRLTKLGIEMSIYLGKMFVYLSKDTNSVCPSSLVVQKGMKMNFPMVTANNATCGKLATIPTVSTEQHRCRPECVDITAP